MRRKKEFLCFSLALALIAGCAPAGETAGTAETTQSTKEEGVSTVAETTGM